ncbi:MAG: hypothetical protein LC097_06380 [Burkholderiales bacterium]|uniref:hypothetical protein n=1 Tax=Comamonas granuli TaxID=290309 RepID=UPI0012EBCD16|nr:hypothetical protein [Comamonas granuli]MCZ2406344.1 hypothetical protein [Burkholderiales bacterium]
MSPFEIVLQAAAGQPVAPQDARAALLARTTDPEATRRRERNAAIRARDAALRDAAHCLAGDGPTAWLLAQRLARAIARFRATTWQRIQAGIPVALSPADEALCAAFLSGVGVPRTQRRLYELLKL